MESNIERRILIRFIKEKNLFNKILANVKKQKRCYCLKHIVDMCFFDKIFCWSSTNEGYSYWYFLQLDYIKLLILSNYTFTGYCKYREYYAQLIYTYVNGDTELKQDVRWSEHESFFNNLRASYSG